MRSRRVIAVVPAAYFGTAVFGSLALEPTPALLNATVIIALAFVLGWIWHLFSPDQREIQPRLSG